MNLKLFSDVGLFINVDKHPPSAQRCFWVTLQHSHNTLVHISQGPYIFPYITVLMLLSPYQTINSSWVGPVP